MEFKKITQPVRNSLRAFLLLLAIVLVCRHLVSDQHQENRIEMLEVQVAQLEASLEAHNQTIIGNSQDTRVPININTAQHTEQKRQYKKHHRNTNTGKDTVSEPSTISKVAKILTDDHQNSKFSHPIRLELNTVDSATLIRVPGIADRTASTILAYRRKLGGFYSPEQLRDKLTWEAAQNYMDEWCDQWFKADESLVQMIHINSLSFKEINNHPYISYEQTKALVRYRDRHKGIRSMAELEQLAEFDAPTLEKLKHYISFE